MHVSFICPLLKCRESLIKIFRVGEEGAGSVFAFCHAT